MIAYGIMGRCIELGVGGGAQEVKNGFGLVTIYRLKWMIRYLSLNIF